MPGLVEASGVVASRNNADVLWTHNDKGGQPRIFAINAEGRWLGTYSLPGASHIDYEDIGIGPGPERDVDFLFVGDIGDKNGNPERAHVTVYRVPEPAVYQHQVSAPRIAAVRGLTAINLRYPDGPRNAEALFVDPRTGDLFVISKQDTTARIYRATRSQLDRGGFVDMSFLRAISFDVASGADISPNGGEIVIRQENFARLWTRARGQSVGDAFAGAPVVIPVVGSPAEKNGEAIGFDAASAGYFTLSDSLATQPLFHFSRTSESVSRPRQTIVAPGSTWRFLDDGSRPDILSEFSPSPQLSLAARRNGISAARCWNAESIILCALEERVRLGFLARRGGPWIRRPRDVLMFFSFSGRSFRM